MAQFDPNLLLEINHLPLVLSFLVHEGLLLLLQPLLDALLVLDDPIQGVTLLPHVLLALLPGVEEPLHPEYYLERRPAVCQVAVRIRSGLQHVQRPPEIQQVDQERISISVSHAAPLPLDC